MKPTTSSAWRCNACDRWNAAGLKVCVCGARQRHEATWPVPRQSPSEPPPATSERGKRGLQSQCETYLRHRGIEYLHLSPRAREKKGWPDLTFAVPQGGDRPGIPYAVELKAEGGALTDDQRACLERLAANGWRTAVVREVAELVALVDAGQGAQADRRIPDLAAFASAPDWEPAIRAGVKAWDQRFAHGYGSHGDRRLVMDIWNAMAEVAPGENGTALHADQPGAWTGFYPTTEG